MASTRLPDKPLVDLGGKTMIQRVYERAARSGASSVVIATDDDRVVEAGRSFGADTVMTSSAHRSGTERVAEVARARRFPEEMLVLNLQGDEPLLPPALIDQTVADLADHPAAEMSTLCEPIETPDDVHDPSVVKVVCDQNGFALYFSRATVPWYRDEFEIAPGSMPPASQHYRHVGLYAYRSPFLQRYVEHPRCHLEMAEALEQLRALFMGARIHVAVARLAPGPGIDTPADLDRVRDLIANFDEE